MRKRAEPTKANLIRLRREAAFARQGLEILDCKREILMRELARTIVVFTSFAVPAQDVPVVQDETPVSW